MAKVSDKYAQFFFMSVTMSAANTLTFAKLALGISMFDYAGLLIHRVEYSPSIATLNDLNGVNDQITFAVTGSGSIAALGGDQAEVYDRLTIGAVVAGAAGSTFHQQTPFVQDFATLPGGGVLVPAQDIYFAAVSSGMAAAGVGNCRVYYTVQQLQATDYLELVQRLRVLST